MLSAGEFDGGLISVFCVQWKDILHTGACCVILAGLLMLAKSKPTFRRLQALFEVGGCVKPISRRVRYPLVSPNDALSLP